MLTVAVAGAMTLAVLAVTLVVATGRDRGAAASTTVASGQAAPTGTNLLLQARVVPASAFAGARPVGEPTFVTTPSGWSSDVEHSTASSSETLRLRGLGFLAGVVERLRAHHTSVASIVEQYSSTPRARAELAHQRALQRALARASDARYAAFRVVGVPGAAGSDTRTARSTRIVVMFAAGPFYYSVAADGVGAAGGTALRTKTTIAAQTLYLLIHGCVATGSPRGHTS